MSARTPDSDDPTRLRIAYVMSRFPKLTETFVLYEMLALETLGVEIEVYPLLRARNSSAHTEGAGTVAKLLELLRAPNLGAVTHREVTGLRDRVHFIGLLSWRVVWANLRAMATRPRRYAGALGALIRGNMGSTNFLLGGLAVFPKTVAAALHMENGSIDHVHAHFANHPAAAAFVIHRLTGIPYSFTAHGADIQVDQHMLCEKIQAAEFAVTVSEYNRRFLLERCGARCASKVTVIRCGVDRSVFAPAAAQGKEARSTHVLRILCIGTMYEVKGHRYLVEACQRLREQGVPFRCSLVGDGPDRAALERRVAELGLADHVIFLGACTRDDVVQALHETDVLAVPSVPTREGRREGIPVVCMEGMAAGVAVVATEISGIPELIEHDVDGLLVPPRDACALADALARIHREPDLKARLARAAGRRIARDYDLHRNAARILAKIRESRP